jgi:hypothetical protein
MKIETVTVKFRDVISLKAFSSWICERQYFLPQIAQIIGIKFSVKICENL